jgi:hypothetical protein
MMASYRRYAFALSLVIAIGGCAHQSKIPIPSETITSTTSTPASNVRDTDTPQPEKTPTTVPTFSVMLTLPPEPALVSGWFSIPRLTHADSIDFSTARSFKGLRIPPLPEAVAIEIYSIQPYGEVPPETIFYQLFLIRKGNTRMLWLGIPFKETGGCCGRETPNRIYDSIPFPAIETDSLLIPFVCMRNQEQDIFLIVVAEPPEKGASATSIHYAWRIDPETISLKPFSTQGIECSPNW